MVVPDWKYRCLHRSISKAKWQCTFSLCPIYRIVDSIVCTYLFYAAQLSTVEIIGVGFGWQINLYNEY